MTPLMVLGKEALSTRFEHHGGHGHLPLVALPARLGVDQFGQQPVVGGDDRRRGGRAQPEEESVTPSAAAVSGPTRPSTVRPLRR